MQTSSFALAACAALAVIAGTALGGSTAATAAQQLKAKPQNVLELKVRSKAEVKRTFGFAAGQRRQAIEISCAPGGSEHCSGDFVTACDNHGGGMSTNPDGSVTCSLPQHD